MVTRTVGERLREELRRQGISLGELSRRTGLSKSYLSALTRDKHTDVRLETARRIAGALGIAPADLIGQDDTPEIRELAAESRGGVEADVDDLRRLAEQIMKKIGDLEKRLPDGGYKDKDRTK